MLTRPSNKCPYARLHMVMPVHRGRPASVRPVADAPGPHQHAPLACSVVILASVHPVGMPHWHSLSPCPRQHAPVKIRVCTHVCTRVCTHVRPKEFEESIDTALINEDGSSNISEAELCEVYDSFPDIFSDSFDFNDEVTTGSPTRVLQHTALWPCSHARTRTHAHARAHKHRHRRRHHHRCRRLHRRRRRRHHPTQPYHKIHNPAPHTPYLTPYALRPGPYTVHFPQCVL